MKRLGRHSIFQPSRWILLLVAATLLNGCGEDSNMFAVIDGQKVSLPIESVNITVGGFTGIPSNPGFPISGQALQISIGFINGNVRDTLEFYVADAGAVVIGQSLYVDQALISGALRLSGINQIIARDNSFIRFDEIGVAGGQTVRFTFKINSNVGYFEGNVSGSVNLGVN